MNEHELWKQSVYDEAWAKVERAEAEYWVEIERIEWEQYKWRAKWWRLFIILWIVASVSILVVTIVLKLYNTMVAQ